MFNTIATLKVELECDSLLGSQKLAQQMSTFISVIEATQDQIDWKRLRPALFSYRECRNNLINRSH